ncbi:hypothetical protein BKA63DRAFT_589858 [Paraphoma chrysanthemicola]|nr:hypothetical protein BKA63DRAFT_589858 [Paraphoma chrysanthemicola]
MVPARNVNSIDTSVDTQIHIAFANITADFQVDISGARDEFDRFKDMTSVKKTIPFGGWAFSTEPGTFSMVCVTSYGRSFKLAHAGCTGPGCLFAGSAGYTNAAKGECTTEWAADLQDYTTNEDQEDNPIYGADWELVIRLRIKTVCESKYRSMDQLEKDADKISAECFDGYLVDVEAA